MDDWEEYWENPAKPQRQTRAQTEEQEKAKVETTARKYGEYGLTLFSFLLLIYKVMRGLPFYDVLALFWGYMAAGYLFRYKLSKTGNSRMMLILAVACAVGFTLLYMVQTV